MRVLVVDDEPIARRRLVRMLGRIDGVEVAGEATDGEDALAKVAELAPDVLLLDIRMPGLDGLSLARGRRGLPPVIFTTAYAEFAVGAFEADAVDYLLKPVEQARLEEALARVRLRKGTTPEDLARLLERLAGGEEEPRLMARERGSAYYFDARGIARIRAANKYTGFSLAGTRYLLDDSIDTLEKRLAHHGFVRVHRAELVNLRFVRALHRTDRGVQLELSNGERVTVSRRRVAEVMRRLASG